MSKTKVILALTFVLVFAAGAVVGMVRHRVTVIRQTHGGPDGHESFMVRLLDLTPEQQKQMQKIWSEMGPGRGGQGEWDRRREYQKQRDDAVRALLSPEQLAKYDAIRKEYDERVAQLGKERQAAFQKAVEQTKAILTPEQVTKYEAFLNKRRDGERREGPGAPGGGPPPPHRDQGVPTTRS